MPDNGEDAARALANANLRQQPQIRGTSSIGVQNYKTGQDFEEYVELFENGVKLATNAQTQAEQDVLNLQWLPLKLDAAALAVYKQARKTTWALLKEDLISLLVDPQEKYKWQARITTIKWDGKESFHALASRIMRAVNKFDKEMPQVYKDRDYYQRFCDALPKYYRSAVHMGCKPDERNIDNAKELALRAQVAIADPHGEGKSVAFEEPVEASEPFVGASMDGDRTSGVERALAGIQTAVENVAADVRKLAERTTKLEDHFRECSISKNRSGGSNQSRGYSSSRERYDSRKDRDNRGNRNDNRGGRNDNRGNQDGNRDDRRDNRDNRGNRDNRADRNDNRDDRGRNNRGNSNRRDRDQSTGSNGSQSRDNRGPGNSRDGGGGNRNRNDAYRAIQTEDESSGNDSEEAAAMLAMAAQKYQKSRKKKSEN